jgi:hypothetical protein
MRFQPVPVNPLFQQQTLSELGNIFEQDQNIIENICDAIDNISATVRPPPHKEVVKAKPPKARVARPHQEVPSRLRHIIYVCSVSAIS